MSPDFFNRCRSCGLILSARLLRREEKLHCPRCAMTQHQSVTMELVTIPQP